MSFLDFLGLGSTDKAESQQALDAVQRANQSLNIEVSIAAHENWLTRLETYVSGHSSEELNPVHIACDDQCDLGKWIYSDGEKYLGEYAAFKDLKATHKLFHFKASSVVSLCQDERVEEARATLANDMHKTSKKIRQRLLDLKGVAEG